MASEEPAPESARWLGALRRAIDILVKIHQNLEQLRKENEDLRHQIIELARIVSYQAGQIHQIDQRIKDTVEAQVLRELDRRGGLPRTGRRR